MEDANFTLYIFCVGVCNVAVTPASCSNDAQTPGSGAPQ